MAVRVLTGCVFYPCTGFHRAAPCLLSKYPFMRTNEESQNRCPHPKSRRIQSRNLPDKEFLFLLLAPSRYRFIRARLLNRLQLPVGSRYTTGISWLNHTKSFQTNHGKKVANYKIFQSNRRKRPPVQSSFCFIRRSLILLMKRSGATAFTIGPKLSTRMTSSASSSAS